MLAAQVRAHASAYPERLAVVAAGQRVSYGELDCRISVLVRELRRRGAGRGALVGIYLDRTADAVAALLAVLGAGAAYTVTEPDESVHESARRLAAVGPDLVITSSRYLDALRGHGLGTLAVPEGEPAGTIQAPVPRAGTPARLARVSADDIACVIYTSGSSGVPKGVMVSHGNIRHYTQSLLARLDISEPLSYAHVTTLAADLGNTSLFLALWTGGALHLVPDMTRRDPAGLLRYLRAERVDVLKATPSHWAAIFRAFGYDRATEPLLRILLLGGELLPIGLAQRILASGVTNALVNHYGPTEATVGVAACVLRKEADLPEPRGAASVPIGTPLGETKLFIRTGDGRFHERDAVGELYVAGPSVTLGYRGDPHATATAFVAGPDVAAPCHGWLYRTGDKVRADSDGVLEFLGREDRQVKVQGYRVELGHVEAGLRTLPDVADATAVCLSLGRPMLAAAVVPANSSAPPCPARLREDLAAVLPSYMIPDRIEVLTAFPRTSNGKADHAEVARLLTQRLAGRSASREWPEIRDPVLAEVCEAWRRQLGHADFGVHDDFYSAGGNSIGAIQVVADLQLKGYQASAAAFMAEPTPAAIAAGLRDGHAPATALGALASDDTCLSPAQQWFFRQRFKQPDQWSQAVLLDVDAAVKVPELAAAVADVVGIHPMLHTAFLLNAGGWRREVVPPAPAFTCSGPHETGHGPAQYIQAIAAACQAQIRVADGTVFKAHLLRGRGQAHLLLIGHHLVVDAVSWLIIINDLSRCYSDRLRGRAPAHRAVGAGFGTWATHLRDKAPDLRADLAYWDDLGQLSIAHPPCENNLEGDASSVWFRLSRAQTSALARTAQAPPAVLLAAFAHALADLDGQGEVMIDMERHGRVSFDERVEISRVVGWFTSTFPVRIGVVDGDVAATAKTVASALDGVPNLGVAYGLHEQPRRSLVCFNYLGQLIFSAGDDLRLAPSRHRVGPIRGTLNDRVYDLKLTARVHDGQIVADISFSPRLRDHSQMLRLASLTRAHLLAVIGIPPTDEQFVVEQGSTSGLLFQVPSALRCEAPAASVRVYRAVLLSGATGFIGAHLLYLLLTRTAAHVYCLVRERDGVPAADRLSDSFAWYLPGADLRGYADRVTVLTADLSRPRFGLSPESYGMLCRKTEAIYHLASDTRLFGARESFGRHNTEPVRAMIQIATTGRPKDLHHVSTLAVCGTGPAGGPAVFSEDSLQIGQAFLNEYERTKYESERLVRDFAANGGTAFIYRPGNVTGHSVSGRFQRNGGDSRLIQILRGCVVIGRVPDLGGQSLALSPVDIVAESILEISRSADVGGGTFHVDTSYQVPYQEIFCVMREIGCALADDTALSFADLLGRYRRPGDERVSLAYFWARRPERNVHYDHTRTQRLLAGLGVEFPRLDRAWLRRFFEGLMRQGELGVQHD